VKTNDMMLVIYISSLVRSVIALHNLINNKVRSSPLALLRQPEARIRNPQPETRIRNPPSLLPLQVLECP